MDASAARKHLVAGGCLALAARVVRSETSSWLCQWRQTERQISSSLEAAATTTWGRGVMSKSHATVTHAKITAKVVLC